VESGLGLGLGLGETACVDLGDEPIEALHSHILLPTLTQFEGHGEVDIYIIKYFSDVHMFFL
jgi:hypothetical protein